MKTFKDLNVGDTLYEHIGVHIHNHTITKTEVIDTEWCTITYDHGLMGVKRDTLLLCDNSSVFPFYTSIEEIRDETEILVRKLAIAEVV